MVRRYFKTLFMVPLTKNLQNYAEKTRCEMFCTFAGLTSLMLNSKLCSFITLYFVVCNIKAPQHFVSLFLHKTNKDIP